PTPDEKPAVEEDTTVASAEDSAPVVEEIAPVVQIKKVKTVAVAAATEVPAPQVVAAYAEPAPAPAVDPVNTASVPSGWAIQVASSPKQSEAQAFLDKTSKQAPKVLADAAGFTVAFDKDGVTYYRARFGGFGSKDAAWNACSALKKKKIACYAVQQ
ncbi:beta-lactamase, partial [Mesorhizobium amorphae CCNWGS0123]